MLVHPSSPHVAMDEAVPRSFHEGVPAAESPPPAFCPPIFSPVN